MDGGVALPGRAGRIDAVLDPGGTTGRPFYAAAPRHRVDDADRQSSMARRTDAADQRDPRCPASVARPRRGADRNALSSDFLPTDLALEATAAPATGASLERTVSRSAVTGRAGCGAT